MNLVLSLFPGLELLDRAFREAGFCVVAGPDRLLGGDIRDFHVPRGRFDGVIGGSPCQSFSALANLVRAKGLEPRFGNLIPEFERVVVEAAPAWFLHENVPRAPVPKPEGYSVQDFVICNSAVEAEDGFGQEQERVRRFTFGVRACSCGIRLPVTSRPGSIEAEICCTCGSPLAAPCLLKWIPRAALRLPAAPAVAYDDGPGTCDRSRKSAVLADAREVPVAIGGSGKAKLRTLAVASDDTRGKRDRANGWGGHGERRTLAEMLRLQGLPEDLLDEQPFTQKAARRMVANGVPLPLGRAVAKAVRRYLEECARSGC